jgi:methionine synthase II (cobalamin-independent)
MDNREQNSCNENKSRRNLLSGLKCKATGIGSVPHLDIDHICDLIIHNFPDIPYWPQAVKTDPKEGMMVQFMENLPCLRFDEKLFKVMYDDSDRENELNKFYENIKLKNYDFFKVNRKFANGFYALLEKTKDTDIKIIKGHVTGPVTFLFPVLDNNGKSLLYDKKLRDAILKGLAMKGVWQAKEIEKNGKFPVIFFDEPGMAVYGTDYLKLGREDLLDVFKLLLKTIRDNVNVLIGIHCCGNTDWGLLLETDIDIISFDAYSYFNHFLLYHENIKKFLNRGGIIAWGIVPTIEFTEETDLKTIEDIFYYIINKLEENGIKKSIIIENSIFTPACGTGSLPAGIAEKILKLTHDSAIKLL